MSGIIHHNNFSAADIEQYRAGKLSPAEMHAMEKAAMEDPFLADAMEGYGVGSQEPGMANQEDNIRELKERLRQRVEENTSKTIAFGSWWKIAAAVIVVAGGVWIFRGSMNNSPAKNSIAAKETAATSKPEVAVTDSTPPGNAAVADTATSFIAAAPVKSSNKPVSSFNKISPQASAPVAAGTDDIRQAPAAYRRGEEKAAAAPVQDDMRGRVAGVDVKSRSKADTVEFKKERVSPNDWYAKRQQLQVPERESFKDSVHEYKVSARGYMNSPLNTFSGQVLDKLNKPVIGASIEIPGRQQSYVTDSLGIFSFKAVDTAVKVSVASVGYVQRYYTLRNSNQFGNNNAPGSNNNMGNNNVVSNSPRKNTPSANNNAISNNAIAANHFGSFSNQIVLQPSNPALNEVVVVGYGSRKKEVQSNRADMSVSVLDAEPVTGWDEFNDYLERNKKIPDGADDIHGSVVVRFNVDSNGTLKNFSIEKSLNQTLDAEAIRLVKEGPSWHLLKGKNKKTKITVMVRF